VLRVDEFTEKITRDFKMEFSEVEVEEKYIRIGAEVTHVELPISSMYKEYQVAGYDNIKKLYIKIANEVLNQYKFKVDYNNVFPLLKSRDFGKGEKNLDFCREQAFVDIDTLYVTDEGEIFRFVLESDDVDFDKIKKRAWENLNKITNPLVKLDKMLDIFCLKYSTDYNSTLLLSAALQKQIYKKVGEDYLFAIPSSTALVVAKYQPEYIKIIESLIMIDKDPNVISDKVYQYKDGKFDIAVD
jgi:uncharacterized protein YtpQ (UPF0354 family)